MENYDGSFEINVVFSGKPVDLLENCIRLDLIRLDWNLLQYIDHTLLLETNRCILFSTFSSFIHKPPVLCNLTTALLFLLCHGREVIFLQ